MGEFADISLEEGLADMDKFLDELDDLFTKPKAKPDVISNPIITEVKPTRVIHLAEVGVPSFLQKCPLCSGSMADRTVKTTGIDFLGCKKYPACKGTRNYPA